MEKNLKEKIKLFENTGTECAAFFSPQEKEEIKLNSTTTDKPRRKKKKQPIQTEQAEYVNIIPVGGAEASGYFPPVSTSSCNYLEFDSHQLDDASLQLSDLTQSEYANLQSFDLTQSEYANLQPFDLAQSEYANLFPLAMSDTARFYADPEGQTLTIKKKKAKRRIKEPTENVISIEGVQSDQLNITKSEYANLFPLGMSDTARFYADPEGQTVTIKKKQTEEQTEEVSVKVTSADEVKYAELDLTQPYYANVLHRSELDTTLTAEYCHLGHDNKLVPININPDQSTFSGADRNTRKTNESLEKGEGVSLGIKSKTRPRKKSISKDNAPGTLSTKFSKLNIQPIQEEIIDNNSQVLSDAARKKKDVTKSSRFNFFSKKPKKPMPEPDSGYNTESMQNK